MRIFLITQELTPDIVTTSSHLEIPLMAAERAWAYAMQRKQETVDAPYRERRHAVTRFAKAAKVKGRLANRRTRARAHRVETPGLTGVVFTEKVYYSERHPLY